MEDFFGGERAGGFLIGRGWALLSPNPIPYLLRDGDALQHAMYCRCTSLLLLGTLPAGMWVFANLHHSFQQYHFVCQRGHINVPLHFALLSTHLPSKVFSHISVDEIFL
jgi:hypothetical protein